MPTTRTYNPLLPKIPAWDSFRTDPCDPREPDPCPHTYGVRVCSCAAVATEPCRPTACTGEGSFAVVGIAHRPFLHTHSHPRPRPAATVWRNLQQHPQCAATTTTLHSQFSILHSSFSHTFSAKERDTETGLSYFGARYYSSDLSIWLSVDPMSDKYPSFSPYVYCADNPVKLVDSNGEEFVGTDGEKVSVSQDENGQISVGDNASEDLKRMASMINNSGSKTAAKQFMKLANNDCKIHFQIVNGEGDGSRIGYHQAHDEQGNPLDWVGDRDNGYFDGTPAIQNGEYKEATITLFEGLIDGDNGYKKRTPFDSNLSTENAMVGVFAHEAEHNLNKSDIRAIKNRSAGFADNVRNVERAAERVERRVYHEIFKNR